MSPGGPALSVWAIYTTITPEVLLLPWPCVGMAVGWLAYQHFRYRK